jgi:putative SOS response-associated peptidase YedK
MRRFVQAFAGADFDPALPLPLRKALAQLPARYNIGKGQPAGVIALQDGQPLVREMSWGLVPSWEKEPLTQYSTQTARARHAPDSRLYRRAWSSRRAVLPLSGYYKWDRDSTPRQPYFIQAASGEVLYAAALWSLWGAATATPLWSFSVLTDANDAIPAPLVPDGPLFLAAAQLDEWMAMPAADALAWLLRQPQPRLEAYAVSRRVANRRLDDYSLLEPLLAVEEFDSAYEPEHDDDDEQGEAAPFGRRPHRGREA